MFYLKSTQVTLIFFFFNYENQSAKVESSSSCVFSYKLTEFLLISPALELTRDVVMPNGQRRTVNQNQIYRFKLLNIQIAFCLVLFLYPNNSNNEV